MPQCEKVVHQSYGSPRRLQSSPDYFQVDELDMFEILRPQWHRTDGDWILEHGQMRFIGRLVCGLKYQQICFRGLLHFDNFNGKGKLLTSIMVKELAVIISLIVLSLD